MTARAATFEGAPRAPQLDFAVPFVEAIAWAEERGVVLPAEFYGERLQTVRARAFTVSGLGAVDQVQQVADSLTEAIAEGRDFRAWQREVRDAEPAVLGLPNGRLELIYRNAVQTAYGIGRTIQQRENRVRRPYLMWDAINDDRTRPTHAAMDGHIAAIDDPVWQQWHPPAGHGCRCTRIALTEPQARARGYPKPAPGVEPDKGWDGDPTAGNDDLLAIVRQRLEQPDIVPAVGRSAPLWASPGPAREALQDASRRLSPRQPQGLFGPYDVTSPRGSPDVSTPARAAMVSFEDRVRLLDRENGAAFDADGAVLLELFGTADALPTTDAAMQAARGGSWTHNHPNGATFSLRDVETAGALQFVELRAVGPQFRHILLPGRAGWPDDVALAGQFVAAQPRARAIVDRMVREDGLNPQNATAELLHQIWVAVARYFGLTYIREFT
jgi:SPP1 gp7 family putative phage head morphogenesis protein